MKKITLQLSILFLAAGLFAAPFVVSAQNDAFVDSARAAASANTSPTVPPAPLSECEKLAFTNLGTCVMPFLVNQILSIVSWTLWLSATLFNFAVKFSLNLAEYTNGSAGLDIDGAWRVVRDLINISFIFIILWIAVQTILGLTGDSRKILGSIIIAALLINFSLFFTKVIIDVSNVIALQFYSSIAGGNIGNAVLSTSGDNGISDQFLQRLKLQGVYARNGAVAVAANQIIIGIFGSIFIFIAAAVFFAAALLLVVRSALLLFLMVTSPIGFVGAWMPRLGEYRNKWWSLLINQSLVAPVFLILIWIILKITEPAAQTGGALGENITGGGSFASVLAGNGSAVGIIFNFIFLIALLIAALNTAKNLSNAAGVQASNMGQKWFGTAIAGGAGFLARQTVGRGFARLAENEGFKNFASKSRFGMLALRGTEKVAQTNFDARAAGGLLKKAGVPLDFGKPQEGGFRKAETTDIQDRAKARQAQAKLIEYKETDAKKAARAAAGDTRTAQQITTERQRSFASALKTPGTLASVLGRAGDTLTGKPFVGIKGDIEGAKKIERGFKNIGQLEEDKKILEDKLKTLLKEFNKGDEEVTEEKIDNALAIANDKLAGAEAQQQMLRTGATVTEVTTKRSAVLVAQKKVDDLKRLKDKIEKIEEKIEKNKKDGDEKKGNKKEEKEENK